MKGVRGPHTNLGNTGQVALACGVSPPAHDVQPGKSTTSPKPARTGPPASGTRMPPPPSRAGLATSRPETHSLLHVPMSPVALLGPQGQQCCRTEWHLTQRLSEWLSGRRRSGRFADPKPMQLGHSRSSLGPPREALSHTHTVMALTSLHSK